MNEQANTKSTNLRMIPERNEMNPELKIAQLKLRHWSGWITAISALGKNFCLVRATIFSGLIMNVAFWQIMWMKFFTGLAGHFLGIIAGALGIRLSHAKKSVK